MTGWPHHWGLCPQLFSNSGVGSFTSQKEPDSWKCCETGTMVFRPYLRRLESLTICRSHCQGSTFSSVILKTLSVGPAGFWTRDLPLSRPTLFQLSQPGSVQMITNYKTNLRLKILKCSQSPSFLLSFKDFHFHLAALKEEHCLKAGYH